MIFSATYQFLLSGPALIGFLFVFVVKKFLDIFSVAHPCKTLEMNENGII